MRKRNIVFDIASLRALNHSCRGCRTIKGCCCASFEVCITQQEMAAIIGVVPEAARFAPHLAGPEGYKNVFDETEDDLLCIDTTERGLCVFAYMNKGIICCSLHSAAETLNLPVNKVKPASCRLWPLAVSDSMPAVVSVCEDAGSFVCNRRQTGPDRYILPEVLDAIESVFGSETRSSVAAAAANGYDRLSV